MSPDYDTYLSPFTWRYGSPEMRYIWSEVYKRRLWRRIWVQLAEVQSEFGLVSPDAVADLQAHIDDVKIEQSLAIEAEIHHDLMAELKVFAGQARTGGGSLHLGATSMDIEDNADVLRVRQSLDIILVGLKELLQAFARRIIEEADTPLMATTHLQPAEPSTLGYRLASYAQDLLADYRELRATRDKLCGKGFKGAVGSGAAYAELIGVENLENFEQRLSDKLELPFFSIATQVYPRKQDYSVISALAGLGGSLYKFAFDLRLLQQPAVGELSEPFGSRQVGSSAMPFKRNPVNAEKIDSLARSLAGMPRLAWDNAAHSLLERTLDDSANRRTLLPEAFLACDELLHTTRRLVLGMVIHREAIERNLEIYGPFAAVERVLMALGKAGADRQEMHERLRGHALSAWAAVQQGENNPLAALIAGDDEILRYLPQPRLAELMDARGHIGDAPRRARQLVEEILKTLD